MTAVRGHADMYRVWGALQADPGCQVHPGGHSGLSGGEKWEVTGPL